MDSFFDTTLERAEGGRLTGPFRHPRNMLKEQPYDSHSSIHDDATAQKLGFRGGAIEGPTHCRQIAPLGAAIWGARWFEEGCVSAHYRNSVYDGESVRAFADAPASGLARIGVDKEDGTEVMRGTISLCGAGPT